MNELIQNLISKVGISEEQAQGAVATVTEFIKDKLPEGMHGQFDKIVSGEGGGMDDALSAAKNALGGFFGKKD